MGNNFDFIGSSRREELKIYQGNQDQIQQKQHEIVPNGADIRRFLRYHSEFGDKSKHICCCESIIQSDERTIGEDKYTEYARKFNSGGLDEKLIKMNYYQVFNHYVVLGMVNMASSTATITTSNEFPYRRLFEDEEEILDSASTLSDISKKSDITIRPYNKYI
ncbi:hypothetical protein ACTA71_006355 [Dictyostelium dimigraforme]